MNRLLRASDLLLRIIAAPAVVVAVLIGLILAGMTGDSPNTPVWIPLLVMLLVLALCAWIMACVWIPARIEGHLRFLGPARLLITRVPVYAVALYSLYWCANRLWIAHRIAHPAQVLTHNDSRFPSPNPHPAITVSVSGTLPADVPLKDLVAIYATTVGSDTQSSCALLDSTVVGPEGKLQKRPLVFVEHVPITRTGDGYRAEVIADRFDRGQCGWQLRAITYFFYVKGYDFGEFPNIGPRPHIAVSADNAPALLPGDSKTAYSGPLDLWCSRTPRNDNPYYPVKCGPSGSWLDPRIKVLPPALVHELRFGVTHIGLESTSVILNFHLDGK